MNELVPRFRGPGLAFVTLVFLACTVWAAHTPGEPRTMRDFLFVIELFGMPFLVFAYALWSLSGSGEEVTGTGKEARIALAGAVLGATSGALLLLLWGTLIEHERIGTVWVLAGMLMATAATLCGIIAGSKLRRPAIVSVLLLPFWIFASALLLKATLD